MTRRKYYALINGYYHKYRDVEKTDQVILEIAREYRHHLCPALCKYNFRLTRKQAMWLCDTLGEGNWKKMWLTEEEKTESGAEICKGLLGDIFYCADRMSWDRLARINWQYQRLLTLVRKIYPIFDEEDL